MDGFESTTEPRSMGRDRGKKHQDVLGGTREGVLGKRMSFDVAMTEDVNDMATEHLLAFLSQGELQEELCFGLWTPSRGGSRVTAILERILLPEEDERLLHGGASFQPSYLSRAVRTAVLEGKGLAFMHSHPSVGWQGMSEPDVVAEQEVIAPPARATGLPLVGLTLATARCSERTGWLAQFGQVQWHSPGARIGSDGARKWR